MRAICSGSSVTPALAAAAGMSAPIAEMKSRRAYMNVPFQPVGFPKVKTSCTFRGLYGAGFVPVPDERM
jgi:hypothetical protein